MVNRVERAISCRKICDALRDLVPFEQFKKPEKTPITFSKVAG